MIKKSLDSNNFYKKICDTLIVINNQNATTDGTPYVYSDLFNFDYLNQNIDQSFSKDRGNLQQFYKNHSLKIFMK